MEATFTRRLGGSRVEVWHYAATRGEGQSLKKNFARFSLRGIRNRKFHAFPFIFILGAASQLYYT
jgi:hypothetical protein